MGMLGLRGKISRLVTMQAAAGLGVVALPVEAHVKWFSKVVNCQQAPLTPWTVLSSPDFLALYVAAIVTVVGVFQVEGWLAAPLHARLSASSERRGAWAGWLMRMGVAVYFVSLLLFPTDRPMMLTPELRSDAAWVPLLQLVIAFAALWRATQLVAALGVACLFCGAMLDYGWFHMLDYLYFAGIVAFMLSDALHGSGAHVGLPFVTLRRCLAVSLMWVSAEKWMYPGWAHDIMRGELSFITMGVDVAFFVKAAGFVEFCLAFLLLGERACARGAALVLLCVMAAAIPLVGLLDAVGHTPLLIALLICAAAPAGHRESATHSVWRARTSIGGFVVGIPGVLGLYYCAHLVAYPTRADYVSLHSMLAVALVILLLWWVLGVGARPPGRAGSPSQRG